MVDMRPPITHGTQAETEDARIRALLGVGQPGIMKKRSVVIDGHRTSVSLENAFWGALKTLAVQKGVTVNQLVTQIDRDRDGNLSSAIRVFILLSQHAGGEETDGTELAPQPLQ